MGLISFAFNSYSPKEQGLLANNVVQKMKGNTLFTALQPEVLILETHYTPFWAAYLEALKGGGDRRDLRNELNDPMLVQMNKLGHLVEAYGTGNASFATASGFELKKTSKTVIKDLAPPTIVSAKKVEGKLGSIELIYKGTTGSKSYDIEIRYQGEAAWTYAKHTTKQSIVLTGLTPGKYLELHVSATGTGELESDYSSVVGVWIS